MSAEALVNIIFFLIGLVGLIGVLATWPAIVLWYILLAIGWGVVIVTNADALT